MSQNAATKILDKPTITVREYREIIPTGENQVYEALHRGDLPGMRIGRSWHILTGPLKKKLGVE